jgi:hypothetical protein
MKNAENFILLTILSTVALVGILLMINSAGITDNAGQAYATNSVSLDMTSGEEYVVYDRQISLEYIDGETIALNIDGVLVKVPNGEKVIYKNLGIFSYGGEEVDAVNELYTATVDFYR